MNSLFYAYCVDCTSIDHPSKYMLLLPTLANAQSVYVQTTGTPNGYSIGITDSSNNIFIASGSQSGYVYPSASVSQTYLLTFYAPASGCPWYTGSSFTTNCWMSQLLSTNNIPLSSKKLHSINTSSGSSTPIYLGLPSTPSLGSEIYVKDCGYGATFNIHIQNTSSNTIDGSTSDGLISTNWGSKHYVYSGGGTSGTWLSV